MPQKKFNKKFNLKSLDFLRYKLTIYQSEKKKFFITYIQKIDNKIIYKNIYEQ